MARPRVLGIGAGNHATVVLDALRLADRCDVVAFVDPRPELMSATFIRSTRTVKRGGLRRRDYERCSA
jgi:FlaA1/EpsC-like NDP-sugar epimerase